MIQNLIDNMNFFFLKNAKNLIQNYNNRYNIFIDENIRRFNKLFSILNVFVITLFFSSNNSFLLNISTLKRKRNRSRRQLIIVNKIFFFDF